MELSRNLHFERILRAGEYAAGSERDFLAIGMDDEFAFHGITRNGVTRGHTLLGVANAVVGAQSEYSVGITARWNGDVLAGRGKKREPRCRLHLGGDGLRLGGIVTQHDWQTDLIALRQDFGGIVFEEKRLKAPQLFFGEADLSGFVGSKHGHLPCGNVVGHGKGDMRLAVFVGDHFRPPD